MQSSTYSSEQARQERLQLAEERAKLLNDEQSLNRREEIVILAEARNLIATQHQVWSLFATFSEEHIQLIKNHLDETESVLFNKIEEDYKDECLRAEGSKLPIRLV